MSRNEIILLIILYTLIIFASVMTLFGNHNYNTGSYKENEAFVYFKE